MSKIIPCIFIWSDRSGYIIAVRNKHGLMFRSGGVSKTLAPIQDQLATYIHEHLDLTHLTKSVQLSGWTSWDLDKALKRWPEVKALDTRRLPGWVR